MHNVVYLGVLQGLQAQLRQATNYTVINSLSANHYLQTLHRPTFHC